MTRPSELEFEEHFCRELGKPFGDSKMFFLARKNEDIDQNRVFDGEMLVSFLQSTQEEELEELKVDLGEDWLSQIKEKILEELGSGRFIFEVLRDGVELKGRQLRLSYFRPETSFNEEQLGRYKSNIFTYVRQFKFSDSPELFNQSIDVVLFMNGLPIVTLELKNKQTGQNVEDAVSQYLNRDKTVSIFRFPFLHLAADTVEVKMTNGFVRSSADDFQPFNRDVENKESIAEGDYPVDYLYHEILRPESLIELIESFLFSFTIEKDNGGTEQAFLFPRYHQIRVVRRLEKDLREHCLKEKELDKKYLIQHSTGSGKSYTIAVMQKVLRSAHVDDSKIFDSVIIVTDRINLDSQIKGTVVGSESQQWLVDHAETSADLAKFLNLNKKVIISTIQKFSVKNLEKILKSQRGKKICFIIDEAHRSQSGKLHRAMTAKFESDEINPQEELLEGLKKRKYPNVVFIALTATPSDKTLNLFGGKVFDTYSMDQAEKEGYVLNVVKNVVAYSTLAKLSQELDKAQEYPVLVVRKKLKTKIFEDDEIIKDKCDRIIRTFEKHTKRAIMGKAKAMVVTSSRLAAVKYKLTLDKLLRERELPYKTLVAFSGTKAHQGQNYTEINMNKIEEKNTEIEDEFNKPEYRFIVVANKFQYGFNQPLLHTMFLDKPVSGSNAVQTIGRLNRTLFGKDSTLVVDFANSYKKIISAFRKYKLEVTDFSNANPSGLLALMHEILSEGIFTKKDVADYIGAYLSDNPADTTTVLSRVSKGLERLTAQEKRDFRGLLSKFNSEFKYLDNLFELEDRELRNVAVFTEYFSRFISPDGKGGKLEQELERVRVTSHFLKKITTEEPKEVERAQASGKRPVPQYATIQEVVDAINVNYNVALGDMDGLLIKEYVKGIFQDLEIAEAIRSNRFNLDKFYGEVLEKKLKVRALDFFLKHSPTKLSEYMQKGVLSFINETAFHISCQKIVGS